MHARWIETHVNLNSLIPDQTHCCNNSRINQVARFLKASERLASREVKAKTTKKAMNNDFRYHEEKLLTEVPKVPRRKCSNKQPAMENKQLISWRKNPGTLKK